MKFKLFPLLTVCLVATFSMSAQDVINTRDGRQIKAKVGVINSKIVQFHRSDNLNGPVYEYSVCELSSIVFENGTTENFAPCNQPDNTPTVTATPNANTNLNVNLNTVTRQSMTETPIPANHILYTGFHTFHVNNVLLPRQMVREIMRKNNAKAYTEFEKGFQAENTGRVLEILGGITVAGGITGVAINAGSGTDGEDKNTTPGWVATGLGALVFVIGAGATFNARTHYSKSVLMYNESLTYQQAPQPKEVAHWALGGTPNGVGFSLRF
jgi:hypothetical protein